MQQKPVFTDAANIIPTSAFNEFCGTGIFIQTFDITGFHSSRRVYSASGTVTLNRNGMYEVKVMIYIQTGDSWRNYNHRLSSFTFKSFEREDIMLLLDGGNLLWVIESFFQDGPEAFAIHNVSYEGDFK